MIRELRLFLTQERLKHAMNLDIYKHGSVMKYSFAQRRLYSAEREILYRTLERPEHLLGLEVDGVWVDEGAYPVDPDLMARLYERTRQRSVTAAR